MNTITTKQLRENMAEVIRDLQRGKSVSLSYRHKVIGVLQPANTEATAMRRGSPKAVQTFLQSANFGAIPKALRDSSKSFKEEIADLRQKDISS